MVDNNPVFTWDVNSDQIFDNNYNSQTCSSDKENFFGKNPDKTFTLNTRDLSTTLTLKPTSSPPTGALWRGLIQLKQGTLQVGLKDFPFSTFNLYPIQSEPVDSLQRCVILENSILTFWAQNIALRNDAGLKKIFILSALNNSAVYLNQLGNKNSFINYGGLITLEDNAHSMISVEGKIAVQGMSGGFSVMDNAQLTIQAKDFVFNAPKNSIYNFSLGGPSYSPDKDAQYFDVTSSAFIQFNNPDPNDNTSCLFDFVNQTYVSGLFNFVTKNPKNGKDINNKGSFIICGLSGNNLEALKTGKFFAKDGQVADNKNFNIVTISTNKVIVTLNNDTKGTTFDWDRNISQTFDESYGGQTCSSDKDDFFGKVVGTIFTQDTPSYDYSYALTLHPQNLTNAAWHGQFLLKNGWFIAGEYDSLFGTLDIYPAQNLPANAPWTIIATQNMLFSAHAHNIIFRADADNKPLILSAMDYASLEFYQSQSEDGNGGLANYGSLITVEDNASARIITYGNMELKADGGGISVMDSASLTVIGKNFLDNGFTGFHFTLGGPSYSQDANRWQQYRPVTYNALIQFGVFNPQDITNCIFDFVNQTYPAGLFNFVTKNPNTKNLVDNKGQFKIFNLYGDNYRAFLKGNYLAKDGKVADNDEFHIIPLDTPMYGPHVIIRLK